MCRYISLKCLESAEKAVCAFQKVTNTVSYLSRCIKDPGQGVRLYIIHVLPVGENGGGAAHFPLGAHTPFPNIIARFGGSFR
jgi:hypothetical protein